MDMQKATKRRRRAGRRDAGKMVISADAKRRLVKAIEQNVKTGDDVVIRVEYDAADRQDQLPPEIRFSDAARHLATKSRAIREIRRRIGAATDECTRMRLRVLEKAIAKDLSLDQVGKIANEAGDVFIYAIGLRGIAEEGFGDALPFILIEPLAGSVERFDRYAELAKDGCVLSEDEKQVGLQRLYKVLGVYAPALLHAVQAPAAPGRHPEDAPGLVAPDGSVKGATAKGD